MQQSVVLTTLPNVIDEANENRNGKESTEIQKEVHELLDNLNDKLGAKKKHSKEICKGCDGICCTKKAEKNITVPHSH